MQEKKSATEVALSELERNQLQPELTLKEPILVCQLKLPEVVRYSVVNQKVQPSTGSVIMLL